MRKLLLLSGSPLKSSIKSSLLGYWRLGDGATIGSDASGNGNNLTNNNSVTSVAGKIGNAGNFVAASSQYLSIADNAKLSRNNQSFTLFSWVNLTSKVTSDMGIISKSGTASTAGIEYLLEYDVNADRFSFTISTGAAFKVANATTFGSAPLATWIFIVGWYDNVAATVNIQVNNGAINSAAASAGSQDSTNALMIGRYATNVTSYLNGKIDEAGMCSKVLTAAEKNYLFNSGLGRGLY